jgi:hypothetical protein
MFRLSIAGILWLIVLAALNFAVLRYFEFLVNRGEDPVVLLVGLMPLFDAFLISFYAAANKRYRFMIMRRVSRGSFAGSFALTTGVTLALCMFLCIAARQHILELIEVLLEPFSKWFAVLRELGSGQSLIGATLCLIMSGPLLAIATVISFVMSRYRLVITRRLPDAHAVEDRP